MNYIHESDSSILVLLQTRMIKCGKVSGEARQIVYTTKHCEFARHRIHFRFRIQNLQRPDQIGTFSIRIHALYQPVHRRCFIFLFVLFEKSSSPTPTTLRWRSTNPPRFFLFYHAHSTDFEKKIEGLWTGWRTLHLLKSDETIPVSKNKVTNPEKYGALSHDSSLCTDPPLHRLYDKSWTCIGKWTPTPDKVFHKLLMSFHIQKKTVRLTA